VTNLVETIDAVASDLASQAGTLGLPAFTTQKYARPLIENVEQLTRPVLAVFPFGMDPYPLDTDGTYENPELITVGWFEQVAGSIETGLVDPVRAKAALQRSEAILEHLKSYFSGVPGVTGQSEGTITRVRFGKVRGDVYACEISLRVTTWS
jgi:hypothetical protein